MTVVLVCISSAVAVFIVGAEIPKAATAFVRAWIPLIQAVRDAWEAMRGPRNENRDNTGGRDED